MKTGCVVGLSGMKRGFSVSLLQDQSLDFAIEEDKLRRFKGLGLEALEELGSRALDQVLAQVRGGIDGVDAVAYTPPIDLSERETAAHCSLIKRWFAKHYGISPPVTAIDHVSAHMAFERAVHANAEQVLMVGKSRVVYSKGPGRSHETDADSTLVSAVSEMARFLGLGAMQVHHLENMAQRGHPRFLDKLERIPDSFPDTETMLNEVEQTTGLTRLLRGHPPKPAHFDFAASLHGLLKKRVLALLQSIPDLGPGQTLALCGGVFQSWSLNDAIAAEFPEIRFQVSFAPGNPGCAIGGPLVLAGLRPSAAIGPFLGPEYSLNEIKSVLDNAKAKYSLSSLPESVSLVCEALEEGKMIGWFLGRSEFGNRALGARSVFANPASPYACENLSAYLKLRPAYFRYAVAMPEERPEASGIESPYLSRSMLLSEYLGDSAVRVQTVSKSTTPVLYELLETFRKRTGVPALLNTSLNYFDEPIACTPRDALKTFGASGLDILVMDGFLLRKR